MLKKDCMLVNPWGLSLNFFTQGSECGAAARIKSKVACQTLAIAIWKIINIIINNFNNKN